jgi:hypothetical protein
MTVDELRKALEGVPGDMLVATYDEGILQTEFVSAAIERCAPARYPLEVINERSGHGPEQVTQAVSLFVIC